jgi:hypothetical protein
MKKSYPKAVAHQRLKKVSFGIAQTGRSSGFDTLFNGFTL